MWSGINIYIYLIKANIYIYIYNTLVSILMPPYFQLCKNFHLTLGLSNHVMNSITRHGLTTSILRAINIKGKSWYYNKMNSEIDKSGQNMNMCLFMCS
jgi:hypothetical protein